MDLNALADQLRPALERAQAEEDELQEKIERVRAERRRLERAVGALTGKEPGRPKKNGSRERPWQPAEETLKRVKAFVDDSDGVTVKDVVVGLEVTKSTADRTLRVLRETEAIRLAGKRGTANVFKPLLARGGLNGA